MWSFRASGRKQHIWMELGGFGEVGVSLTTKTHMNGVVCTLMMTIYGTADESVQTFSSTQ